MNDDQRLLFDRYLSSGFAEAYGPASVTSPYYQRMFARNIGPHLPTKPTAQVVDIGCGLGHFLYYLRENGYTNILGVDVGAEPVEFCRQHITPNVLQIDSIETFLAEKPGPYDIIGFFDVIEHLPKPVIIPTLRLLRGHLAPGGVLFIRTGNMASPIGPRVRFGDFTHEVGFTEFSLGQVLNAAGFQPGEFDLHAFEPPAPKNLKQQLRVALHKLVQLLWRSLFVVEASPPPRITAELILAVARRPS
jgi:SAM-dependent methyltransferase